MDNGEWRGVRKAAKEKKKSRLRDEDTCELELYICCRSMALMSRRVSRASAIRGRIEDDDHDINPLSPAPQLIEFSLLSEDVRWILAQEGFRDDVSGPGRRIITGSLKRIAPMPYL